MKHTKGPWIALPDMLDNRTHGVCIFGNPSTPDESRMGTLVATTDTLDPENEDHAEEMIANAERIVECVNACEGIENPAKYNDLMNALQRVSQAENPEQFSERWQSAKACFDSLAALGVK